LLLGCLGEADLYHLPRVVPFVDRGGDVEPLIALQPDQPPLQRRRQHLGDLGLADPGLAFEKQRPLQVQGEVHRRRQAAVGDVVGAAQHRQALLDRGGKRRRIATAHGNGTAATEWGYGVFLTSPPISGASVVPISNTQSPFWMPVTWASFKAVEPLIGLLVSFGRSTGTMSGSSSALAPGARNPAISGGFDRPE